MNFELDFLKVYLSEIIFMFITVGFNVENIPNNTYVLRFKQ